MAQNVHTLYAPGNSGLRIRFHAMRGGEYVGVQECRRVSRGDGVGPFVKTPVKQARTLWRKLKAQGWS